MRQIDADLTGVTETRAEMERAFGDALEALECREIRKTGVGDNALCLVIATVLESIHRNFGRT